MLLARAADLDSSTQRKQQTNQTPLGDAPLLCRHRALFASGSRGAVAAASLGGSGAAGGAFGGAAAGAAVAAAAAAAGGGIAAGLRRPTEPVQLLTYDNLACSVPARRERSWRGPWAARQQAASADTSAAAGKPDESLVVAGQKQILKGVSGVAACGELVGVLGPSGG